MMRAYLAVLRDSFRAAFASRVLYVLFALILLLLVAIAPFHVDEVLNWKIGLGEHVPEPQLLVERVTREGPDENRAAMARIWSRLSDSLKADMTKIVEEDASETGPDDASANQANRRMSIYGRLVQELNEIIGQRDLYDQQAWKDKRLTNEAEELIDRGVSNLSEVQMLRLNRLLVDAACGRHLRRAGATQLEFFYLIWKWSFMTTAISHGQFANGVTSQLPYIFDKFVMSIGLFIAILVTSSIIPEMLEPGSLNLLLSKPISRWGLLLTKFVGGCAFILLCAALFFVGIWLWMGVQLGIWERAFLLSIPIYVLVFAMYYSVSVLVGLWFRSAILCVTFAVLFWAVCFGIGSLHNWFLLRLQNVGAIELVQANDEVFFVDAMQDTYRWNGEERAWMSVKASSLTPEEEMGMGFVTFWVSFDELPDFPGPAFDNQTQSLFLTPRVQPGIMPSRLELMEASSENGWQASTAGKLPGGTIGLFSSDRGPLAVTRNGGFFRLQSSVSADSAADEQTDPAGKTPQAASREFDAIGSIDSVSIDSVHSVSLNPTNGEVAFYSQGRLYVCKEGADGKYETRVSREIGQTENPTMASFVVYRGDRILLALGNGRIYQLGNSDLHQIHTLLPDNRTAIRSVAGASDGSVFAITYRGGRLLLYDADAKRELGGSRVRSQKSVAAATFDSDNRLWVIDRLQRIFVHDTPSLRVEDDVLPKLDWFTSTYRFALRPLYSAFPKPSEFYKVVARLSTSAETTYNPEVDLTKAQHLSEPWSPLRNGLIFMTAVLALSCLVFQRQDF